MKILNTLAVTLIVLSVGCKTQKIAPKPEPISTENTSPAKAVASKEERVTAAKGEASDLGSKRFYIIIGSFGVYENAQKFKKQLMSEDFFPGILVNESGLFRVSVNSSDDENISRAKIAEIRQKFPKYNDIWLLAKKK